MHVTRTVNSLANVLFILCHRIYLESKLLLSKWFIFHLKRWIKYELFESRGSFILGVPDLVFEVKVSQLIQRDGNTEAVC